MKRKIIIIFIILVALFFAYYIFQGSRFKKTNIFENKTGKVSDNFDNTGSADQNNNEKNNAIAPNIEVKPSDCDKDCLSFTIDNEKEYCEEICGLTSYFEDANEEGGTADDCNDEKGLQKDYCLKDISVGNKDFKTCDEIKDSNIRKSCQNRVTEDLIEQQNSFGQPVD